jgi:lysozyme family protein
MSFDKSVELIMYFEGGYIDDPNDSGGETKYGISKRTFPEEDIKNLTIDRAREIYKKHYWDKIQADKMPDGVNTMVFDFAVNAGVYRAIKELQKVLKVTSDGVLGNKTLAAISNMPAKDIVIKYTNRRIMFYAGISSFKHFGKGWVKRATHCLVSCLSEIEGR